MSLMAVPGERLGLRLDYRADLFDRSSIEVLCDRLVRVLEAAVAGAERSIGSLEILGAEERHTILRDWNATSHAVRRATVVELFAAQAARTPDAVRWCPRTRRSPTRSLTVCRAGWRITFAVSG